MTKILVYIERSNLLLRLNEIPEDRSPDAECDGILSLPQPGMVDEFQGKNIYVTRLEVHLEGTPDRHGRALLIVSDII